MMESGDKDSLVPKSNEAQHEEHETFRFICSELIEQARSQFEALQLTINVADKINNKQDVLFNSRMVANKDEFGQLNDDDKDWKKIVSNLSLEEKSEFIKQLKTTKDILDKLSEIYKDQERTNFPLLLDLAVKMNNGSKLLSGSYRIDYDVLHEIETNSWWSLLKTQLNKTQPEILEHWQESRMQSLDSALIDSLGHQGTVGYLLDIFDDESMVEQYGKKQLRKQLQRLSREITSNERKNKLFFPRKKNHEIYRKAFQELNSKENSNYQKIKNCYDLLEQEKLPIPKTLETLYQRLSMVEAGRDVQEDNTKRLRTMNLLRLASMLIPLAPGKNTSNVDSDNSETAFHRLLDSQAGHQITSLVEKAAFSALSNLPENFWANVGDNYALFSLLDDPSIVKLKAIIDQFDQDLASGDRQTQAADLAVVYPDDRIDALVALYSKENPNYESLTNILHSSINQYQKMCQENNQVAQSVYWQRHPNYVGLEFVENLNYENVFDVSKNDDINTILDSSDNSFGSWDGVMSLYKAIDSKTNIDTEEEIKVYFADYFRFVLDKYNNTKQVSGMEDLLAVALYKNNGDMSQALWDVSIFYKIITRNDQNTMLANIDGTSGSLAIKYLKDQFSSNYTASDLAQLLPEQEYWNIQYYSTLKDFDPSNLAGIPYHITNSLALLGEFSSITVVAGLLYEFINSSSGYEQHGPYKLKVQLEYLINNMLPAQQFLESLPGEPASENIVKSNVFLIPLEPYDQRLYGDKLMPVWENLVDGWDLRLPDGKVVRLTGSPVSPSLLISDSEDHDLYLKTEDVNLVNLDVDSILKSQDFFTNNKNEVFPELDTDDIVKILVQQNYSYDGTVGNLDVVYMDSVKRDEVLATLKQQYPDDWMKYVVGSPLLAESMKGLNLAETVGSFGDDWDVFYFFTEICAHYSEGWNKVWTPEEVSTVIIQIFGEERLQRFELDSPKFFQALHQGISLKDYIKLEAESGDQYTNTVIFEKIISNYDYGYDQIWTKEEIISELFSGDYFIDSDFLYEVSENSSAKHFLDQVPLELIVSSLGKDDISDMENLAEYVNERASYPNDVINKDNTEKLLHIVQTEYPENWMYFVFNCSKVFTEYYKNTSFNDFINQFSVIDQEYSLKYFLFYLKDTEWNKNWSPDEMLSTAQQILPLSWGNLVFENVDIFATTIKERDMSIEKIMDYSLDKREVVYNIVDFYEDYWSDQLPVKNLLSLMDAYCPEDKNSLMINHTSIFIPFFRNSSFKKFIKTDEMSAATDDILLYGLDYYRAKWGYIWSEKEIRETLKELYPDQYNHWVEDGRL